MTYLLMRNKKNITRQLKNATKNVAGLGTSPEKVDTANIHDYC